MMRRRRMRVKRSHWQRGGMFCRFVERGHEKAVVPSMPRDLPLANGQLLVSFDLEYHLIDMFYPYIGKENQTDGHICRMGVFRGGKFAWLPEGGWQCLRQRYLDDALVTDCAFAHEDLGLVLHFTDAVDFHEPVLVRRVMVERTSGPPDDEVRLFFHHDFRLQEVEIGNCAVYDPGSSSVIHYKEDRYALVGGMADDQPGLHGYAIGIKEFRNLEGTWKDAEDGVLEGNPVSQGAVDSTVCLSTRSGSAAYLWVAFGQNEAEVMRIHETVLQKGPEELLRRTQGYWHAWLNPAGQDLPEDLPEGIRWLYLRSLLIARTQVDGHGGILAANDWDITRFNSDTYGYIWPRDAALVADAFDRAGHIQVPRRFFRLCVDLISPGGYFLHKYNPDGTPGSTWHSRLQGGQPHLPIQEDETALVLWALWRHFQRHHHVEEVKPYYRPLIIRAGDFLLSYRDEKTGLPLPSHDLWEERWGILTFTVAATRAGLMAAKGFAETFGEAELAERYGAAADAMQIAAIRHLYSRDHGRFARMAGVDPATGEITGLDMTPDASLMGLLDFDFLPASDERLARTVEQTAAAIQVRTEVGGYARYPGDTYQRVEESQQVPGNPWFIASLWYARWKIATARSLPELESALEGVAWCVQHALPSGVLAEQIHPRTHEPLSVSPLTWSHAFFVSTVRDFVDRRRELERVGT